MGSCTTVTCSRIVCLVLPFTVIVTIFGPWAVAYLPLNAFHVNLPKNITEDSDLGQLRRQHPVVFFDRSEYLVEICFPSIDELSWLKWFKTEHEYGPRFISTRRYCICRSNADDVIADEKSLAKRIWYLNVCDSFGAFLILITVALGLRCRCRYFIIIVCTIVLWISKVSLNLFVMVTMLQMEVLEEQPTAYLRQNEALRAATTKTRGSAFACMVIVLVVDLVTAAGMVAIFMQVNGNASTQNTSLQHIELVESIVHCSTERVFYASAKNDGEQARWKKMKIRHLGTVSDRVVGISVLTLGNEFELLSRSE